MEHGPDMLTTIRHIEKPIVPPQEGETHRIAYREVLIIFFPDHISVAGSDRAVKRFLSRWKGKLRAHAHDHE